MTNTSWHSKQDDHNYWSHGSTLQMRQLELDNNFELVERQGLKHFKSQKYPGLIICTTKERLAKIDIIADRSILANITKIA